MTKHIILLNYPESDWGTDLVEFSFDHDVSARDLENELEYAKADLCAEDFDSLQDYADAVCNAAAETLHGTWRYFPQTCAIDIQ